MICNLVAVSSTHLEELREEPSGLLNVFFPGEGENSPATDRLDLDKMWHGLHYVLTGAPWGGVPPLSLAVLGGTEIGEDTGYGPPRYLTPGEVCELAAALNDTPHETFMARFDPAVMNNTGVYPSGWEECEPQYLRQHLAHLAEFYRKAAAAGRAVLICLS
jgi:hypothetical protein